MDIPPNLASVGGESIDKYKNCKSHNPVCLPLYINILTQSSHLFNSDTSPFTCFTWVGQLTYLLLHTLLGLGNS